LSSFGFSWSPDGKHIAVVSPGPNNTSLSAACAQLGLYIVPIDGGKPMQISPPRRGIGCGVAWSPLGGEIAYGDAGDKALGIISTNGGLPRILLSSGVGAPQWSPDGRKLAAPTVIPRGQHRSLRYQRITVVNADGSDPHVVTDRAYTEYPFAWSPDSRQILYGREDRHGIYVIGADGRGDHRLTRDSPRRAGWGALAWSPDGGSIVYAADRADNDDLYVIDANGHNTIRLTSSAASEIEPSWQPRYVGRTGKTPPSGPVFGPPPRSKRGRVRSNGTRPIVSLAFATDRRPDSNVRGYGARRFQSKEEG
jgi:Tol biopolymer transport system component